MRSIVTQLHAFDVTNRKCFRKMSGYITILIWKHYALENFHEGLRIGIHLVSFCIINNERNHFLPFLILYILHKLYLL